MLLEKILKAAETEADLSLTELTQPFGMEQISLFIMVLDG